ncbi:MAG: extracellular solute-binding protein [Rhodospirillum sp.]|nr:extracellular solute-binding protein [Rhodospirillum sp.]MCF8489151.1 extracellular solute-binding protein [Rhodospirillum sp.]MCF8499818.1 extracellular solute-binding protein [Rhodospirillum sp.]
MRLVAALTAAVLSASFAHPSLGQTEETPAPAHGLALYGDPKYPVDFSHFDYVNPDAPKGGDIRLATIGGFDSLNPYIIKGDSAAGLGLTYDTLMVPSADEVFTKYGLIAETVEIPKDRSWVRFTLRPEAKWSDGEPITAEDVAFSMETLRTKGAPLYNAYYASVTNVEVEGERTVRFDFEEGENRELPLIVSELPILPKHYWESREFTAVSLDIPVTSGPYAVKDFEPGRYITLQRRDDYWAKDLAANRGKNNFDTIRYDYYRDSTVMFEAFKAGAIDFRQEMSAKAWATKYDFPAAEDGRVVKETLEHHRVEGMQGFVYNTRNPLFADPKVREALANAFDFEWTNQTLSSGGLKHHRSYFDNSDLAATGLPSAAELAVLEPLREDIPERVFTEEYNPPSTDTPGGLRANLKKALDLLREAGWSVKDGKLVNGEGKPFSFEILLVQPEFEKIILPMAKNLERLGIDVSIRTVDTAQYINRLTQFDYDMIVGSWGQTESPGNEQRDFWSSAAADTPGSRNLAGLKNPAVDRLIDQLIASPSREDLVTHVHALDRILQWSFLVIPQFYFGADFIAHWDMFGHPPTPSQGVQLMTWWVDPEKAASLTGRSAR